MRLGSEIPRPGRQCDAPRCGGSATGMSGRCAPVGASRGLAFRAGARLPPPNRIAERRTPKQGRARRGPQATTSGAGGVSGSATGCPGCASSLGDASSRPGRSPRDRPTDDGRNRLAKRGRAAGAGASGAGGVGTARRRTDSPGIHRRPPRSAPRALIPRLEMPPGVRTKGRPNEPRDRIGRGTGAAEPLPTRHPAPATHPSADPRPPRTLRRRTLPDHIVGHPDRLSDHERGQILPSPEDRSAGSTDSSIRRRRTVGAAGSEDRPADRQPGRQAGRTDETQDRDGEVRSRRAVKRSRSGSCGQLRMRLVECRTACASARRLKALGGPTPRSAIDEIKPSEPGSIHCRSDPPAAGAERVEAPHGPQPRAPVPITSSNLPA